MGYHPKLDDLMSEIGDEILSRGTLVNGEFTELTNYSFKLHFSNSSELSKVASKDNIKNMSEIERKNFEAKHEQEFNHYNKLKYTLLHAIHENMYYLHHKGEKLVGSRRFISLSTDCLSIIQLLIRNNVVNYNVFFRSSLFESLLLPDLVFLLNLHSDVLKEIYYIKEALEDKSRETNLVDYFDYNDVSKALEILQYKPINYNITIGSLHTVAKIIR